MTARDRRMPTLPLGCAVCKHLLVEIDFPNCAASRAGASPHRHFRCESALYHLTSTPVCALFAPKPPKALS